MFLIGLIQSCDDPILPINYTTMITYNLSDTTGIIHLGDTLTISTHIPNPFLSITGESVSYNSIKRILNLGFASAIIGDTTFCKQPSFFFETKKGLDFTSKNFVDFDFATRNWKINFIPKDTGWYTFDCGHNESRMQVMKGKEQLEVLLKYQFNGKNDLKALNAQYPCNKQESNIRTQAGVGYYCFKVVK